MIKTLLLSLLSILVVILPSKRTLFSPPVCFAGNPQEQQLPTTTTTLVGTASGTGGATISSTTWSIQVDPTVGGVSITSASSLTTGITGMTIWGNYVFRLIATDNNGLHDTSYVRVNVVPACNVLSPVRYNLTGSGGEIFVPNARTQPWRGGDTLVLPASGIATDVIFGGFTQPDGLSGDPCNPIIIMGPNAGQAFTSVLRFDDHCQYIKIINNPRNTNPYSIMVNTMGMSLGNHWDVSGVDINGKAIAGAGATGIICKRHIDTFSNGIIVPETAYPAYQMTNYHFHNMRIRFSDGEGWYIGPTAPNGGDGQGPTGFFPVRLDSVEIDHNITDSTGWDGIQLSGALNGCSIHDNIVTHYGLVNMGSQQAGIILGGSCAGPVYNNTIINGTGNGLELFGYGVINCYNNTMDSCGRDGTGGGQQTVFAKGIPSIVESNPNQQIQFFNNYVKNPRTSGAFVQNNDNGAVTAPQVYNNHFCIPGANPATWEAAYINGSPTPVKFGNNLFCGVLNQFQFCSGCRLVGH